MKLETFEPRNGDSWRYVHKDANSTSLHFIVSIKKLSHLIELFVLLNSKGC